MSTLESIMLEIKDIGKLVVNLRRSLLSEKNTAQTVKDKQEIIKIKEKLAGK